MGFIIIFVCMFLFIMGPLVVWYLIENWKLNSAVIKVTKGFDMIYKKDVGTFANRPVLTMLRVCEKDNQDIEFVFALMGQEYLKLWKKYPNDMRKLTLDYLKDKWKDEQDRQDENGRLYVGNTRLD